MELGGAILQKTGVIDLLAELRGVTACISQGNAIKMSQ